MWFSCSIIILELVLSILFNLSKLSSNIFHPFCDVHPCTCDKYFPCHSYMAWGYSKNILSLSLKFKYICSCSQIPAHRLTFTLMCSFHNIVAYHDTQNCTIKVILVHITPFKHAKKILVKIYFIIVGIFIKTYIRGSEHL